MNKWMSRKTFAVRNKSKHKRKVIFHGSTVCIQVAMAERVSVIAPNLHTSPTKGENDAVLPRFLSVELGSDSARRIISYNI